MKNYCLLYVLIMALIMVSCKNEDISVYREVSFEVNPKTVISLFTEDPLGEITELPSNGKLRVRLLVYDEDGNLAQSSEQQLNGYDERMNTSLQLLDGKYIAIIITDVVKDNSEVTEYWTLEGETQLSTLKINKAGYISLYNILGVAKHGFVVELDGLNEHTINVEPAGALFLSFVYDLHHYDEYEITRYELLTNRTSGACVFNDDGICDFVITNSNFRKRIAVFEPQEHPYSYSMVYYDFELPLGRTSFKWQAEGEVDLSDEMVVNVKAGEEYAFVLDLEAGTYYWSIVNGGGKGTCINKPYGSARVFSYIDSAEHNIVKENNKPRGVKIMEFFK